MVRSASLVFKELQIRTTIIYQYIGIRRAITEKTDNITNVIKDVKKVEPSSTAGGDVKW